MSKIKVIGRQQFPENDAAARARYNVGAALAK